MKRTHKLRGMGDVQATIDSSRTLDEAAGRLGVNRSTLTRWLQTGKVKRPASFAQVELKEGKATPPAPTATDWRGWAEAVRDAYVLSPTDHQLVALAARALELAYDVDTKPVVQLMSMARFAALVKQLNLQSASAHANQPPAPAKQFVFQPRAVSRSTADPRAILMAAK